MFILRHVSENGSVTNTILGNNYQFIPYCGQKETFMKTYKNYYENLPQQKEDENKVDSRCFGEVYAFLISEKTILPLFINECSDYIMTDSGKTFENISFKK